MSSAARLNRSYSCKRRTSSAGQQQPRLDLGQDRGHQQVFSGQFQPHHIAHQLDVAHVLPGDLGDRDIQDVQVLPPDQIQQQIQRTFECLQDHLERIRRYVQILRHLQHRLTAHDRQWHFLLLRYRRKRILRCGDQALWLDWLSAHQCMS